MTTVCIEAMVLFAPSCVNGGFTVSVRTTTCTRIDPGEASMTTLKLTGLRKKSVVPLPILNASTGTSTPGGDRRQV